jgi:PTH1 family peptidyl-tRNA hydrolase
MHRVFGDHVRLIVGLGNPGRQYAFTRHNLGFLVIDYLAAHWGITLGRTSMDCRWGQGRSGGRQIILAQPQTYMNLSGGAVAQIMRYFKLTPADLVVVHDDLDVPAWRLKMVNRGTPGGHRGIASLISMLGTEEFIRVKLGIGRPPPELPAEAFVLQIFPASDAEAVAALVERGGQAVETLLKAGLAQAQNRFHGEPTG